LLISASAFLLSGCNNDPAPDAGNGPTPPQLNQDRSAGAFKDTDPWVLKTTDPKAGRGNHGIFLGNGLIGATFGASGTGAGTDARSYVYRGYDPQENFKAIGNWHDLGLPEPKSGETYEQTLDMKRGILTTKVGGTTITTLLSITAPLNGWLHVEGATPTPPPAPAGFDITDGADSSGGWTRRVRFQHDNSITLVKSDPPTAPAAPSLNFTEVRAKHEAEWAKRWGAADITIEGDPEAQQLVRKLLFDLMQSARPEGNDSIPPETLSGDFYKGHIFWDAEVWMFPALVALHPDLARGMLDYRFERLDAAKALAKKQGCAGADFPWESAATGKETAPGGFSQGRHVTAGVGAAVWLYWQATGDKKWMTERGWPLLSNVATYFATKAKKNAATGKYDIKNVTGPDEFGIGVNNNTYTNAMARKVLLAATDAAGIVGQKADPRWAEIAKNLTLPFDKPNNRYLKCEGDKGEKTKQADGELLLYPAELPMDPTVAAATFDFHAARPITNGPAMTDSIHALVAARLGRADEAEKNFRDSYRPFMRGPFLLFSEKRSMDRCVFTTGAGGVLQSVIYGFGGLSYSEKDGLIKGPVALPKGWTKLTITGIHRGSKRYTLTVTPQGRTLTAM
jgi:trehalose/maltose hydrolase-like predicted phosphorylase